MFRLKETKLTLRCLQPLNDRYLYTPAITFYYKFWSCSGFTIGQNWPRISYPKIGPATFTLSFPPECFQTTEPIPLIASWESPCILKGHKRELWRAETNGELSNRTRMTLNRKKWMAEQRRSLAAITRGEIDKTKKEWSWEKRERERQMGHGMFACVASTQPINWVMRLIPEVYCIPVGKSTPSRPRKSVVLTERPVRANDRFPVPFVGR